MKSAICTAAWITLAAATLSAAVKPGSTTTVPPVGGAAPVSQPLPGVTAPGFQPVSGGASATAATTTPVAIYGKSPRVMKILVLSANGSEPSLAGVKSFMDHIGIPYEVVNLSVQPFPALTDGSKALYQAVILATGNLAICDTAGCRSAMTAANWTTLDNFTRDWGVRVVSYYTWPEARYGISYMSALGTDTTPANAVFTAAAASVYTDLNRANALKIRNAYTYLATATPATGETTTPLLTVNGAPVAVLHTKADGREYLAYTFDTNQYLIHSMALSYGTLNWVTKGVFVGARKAYLTPQSDDLFLGNDLFVKGVAACMPNGFTNDPTYDQADLCPVRRISGGDLLGLANWQTNVNSKTQFKNFKTSMAYNGVGLTTDGGAPAFDDLKLYTMMLRGKFIWINHTYDHENLDCYDPVANSGATTCKPATYAQSLNEITKNVTSARSIGLTIDATSMVTPAISGLTNPNFLSAAAGQGIRYLVGDMSRPEGNPASPNTGIRSPLQASILIIPRRATNVFYNTVSGYAGANGSLVDEYNYFFGPQGMFKNTATGQPFFSTNQTYAQIIDHESDLLLANMLRYEIYPCMFHQGNFYRFDGQHSLYSDLMDATFNKFAAISTIPVMSLTQSDIGKTLEARMALNAAKVQATLTPGVSITFTGSGAATVPVTGICKNGCESYASQSISQIPLAAGSSVTVSLY